MRKRKIRKIGNSFYVLLSPADIKDWNLEAGDEVNVEKVEIK